MRRLNILAAWLVILSTVFVLPGQASALPGGIDTCFFRDLNGSGTQGDNLNPGEGAEVAFTAPVSVELFDLAASAGTSATSDPVTGCVEFPGLNDGTSYELRVTYPPEFYSSPVGGDTDFVPGPPPALAGDPFTSVYAFTYTAGDDLSVSGGVSGRPELSLGYFNTPSGQQMIETGTAPFDTTGNCPTLVSGDDCGEFDEIVRTNDITTVGYTITADNIPDGVTNPLNNVVLEQTITPNPGAIVAVPSLHPSCLTVAVAPVSGIAIDPVTGVITVTCNLGSKDNGTSIIPTYIRTDGGALNGSSFTIGTRVYTADDRAQVFDGSSILEPEAIFVSAAPRFDITKANDASNPHNRVIYYQTTQRLNPVTGETEYGVNYQWDISVLYDGGVKGQAALDGPITFSDIIPAEFVGWDLVACNSRPYGAGNMPNDDRPEEDWGDRGTWSCTEDRANNEIDISVTGVDTDGSPVPTEGTNGNDLSAGPFFAFAGSVRIWYPLSDFYRTVDPTWTTGDVAITGDYPLENVVGNFDPVDLTGQSNFDADVEPLTNNVRQVTVPIRERGGFSKHLGAYEWADARIPDGDMVGTAATWPCSMSTIDRGSLMSGQTQRCTQGDAPAQPGERAHFWFWLRNDGTFPWPADTVGICDAFDNSTMALTTWTGGEPVYVRPGAIPGAAVIVEYATAGFNDDVAAGDWSGQLAAIRDCTAPNNDWSSDPYSFDADPNVSLDRIGMIRIRLDDSVHAEMLPSQYLQVSFPVEVRNTFNGGPNDGLPIPVGTILANNANRIFGSTPYSARFMNASTYTSAAWGDRLTLHRHQVRIVKTVSIDPLSSADDDLFLVQGSDLAVWWLQPSVTAVTPATAENVQIIDTLPAGVSFDAFCQSRQNYPDPNIVLTSVTENADGTTTVVFDLGDRITNEPIGAIPLCSRIDSFLEPGSDLTNVVEISSDGDVSPASTRSDNRTVTVIAAGELQLTKDVDAPLELQLDTQTYTIGWTNLSRDFDFLPPDVIDVWPYNGDAVNPLNQRTEFDSNYTGSYELTDWIVQPTTTVADGSTSTTAGAWYYSADNPDTIPYDADNPANDLATGSVTWCTQVELTAGVAPCDFTFSDSTAARFVQTEILESESQVLVEYTFQAGTAVDPNLPADRYVNRFAARTDSVDDLIRSNEVLVQVLSMNIGDLVFLDADVDGRYTMGVDVPIAGTPVELWSDDGTGTFAFAAETTTDANGRYIFEDLLEGTYEVRIPDAELAGGTLDTWTQTVNPLPADNDDNEDIDQQARDSGLGYTTSGPVTLVVSTVNDPPLGLEPIGENIFNLGSPYTFDNLSNTSVDLGFQGAPEVRIIKEVCDLALGTCDLTTDPLDPADGWVETAVVPFTDTANWRITVLNTGDEVLTNVSIDDDNADNCDLAIGTIADLGVGETFMSICSTPNLLADVLNTAEVTAFGIGSGVEVSDADSAAVETPPASNDIEVVKYVNGDDAQTAPGPVLDPGSAIAFTYEVTTGGGSVPLRDVEIIDDSGTPTDLTDDFSATYVSGDTDGDTVLDLNETWLFNATGFTATSGQYANWATVSGRPVTAGSAPVLDTDPAHYFGSDPAVSLIKFVNGQDADTAPGALIDTGAPAVFTYEVRNTGNIAVTVASFTDDAGTAGDLGDDWTPTLVSGDDNGNGALDIDETWRFEHTSEVASEGQYTNTATLTVEDTIGNGRVVEDLANLFGSAPSMELQKATNTIDADVDPVLVGDASPVVWTYEVVNTGNVAIGTISVLDDAGTAAEVGDDFFATFVSGDTNNNDLLDVDETWLFRATGAALQESYRNNAVATGRGPVTTDADGGAVSGVEVRSEDPSSYFASDPDIAIVKSTNGVDSNTGPGAFVPTGEAVTWTYAVTNPGNVPLSSLEVTDDNGTASAADDLTPSYVSGDGNGDGLLDTDEMWVFEATGVATAGQYRNTATVSGRPPIVTGPDGSITLPVLITDTDTDFYFGSAPDITIAKTTNSVDSNAAPGVLIIVGDAVRWSYTVSNPGNVALANVSVVDDNGTASTADDLTASYLAGDADGDDLLDPGETWVFEATGTAIAGQYSNTAVVTGTPPTEANADGSTTAPAALTDDDVDFYFGVDRMISLITSVNGNDANDAPGVLVPAGDDVSWEYVVTNTGNTPLIDVAVVDDMGIVVTCPGSTLDVGESMTCTGPAQPAELGQYTNVGTVTATPASLTSDPDDPFTPILGSDGNPIAPVADDDPANHFGSGPGIAIQKQVCDLDDTAACDINNDDHWTEQSVLANGDAAMWRMQVTNVGNVDVIDVAVTDPIAPDCARERPVLATGSSWAFTCLLFDVMQPTTNTAFVEGTSIADPLGDPVSDEDTASTVPAPELELQKTVSDTTVITGDTVTYTLRVQNSGVSDATDVEIVDSLPAGLSSVVVPAGAGLVYNAAPNTLNWTIDSLPVGAARSVSFTAVVTGVGPIMNEATLVSAHEENDLTNNADTATLTATPRFTPSPLASTGSNTLQLLLIAFSLMAAGAGFIVLGRKKVPSPPR